MQKLLAFSLVDINKIEAAISEKTGVRRVPNIGYLISGGGFNLMTILFFVAGALFVFYLVAGGLKLMTSKGDPSAVGAAKQMITNALVGLLIVIGAYWIVQLAGVILDLPGIQNTF